MLINLQMRKLRPAHTASYCRAGKRIQVYILIYIYTVLFFFFLLFENNTCIGFFRLLFLFRFVLFGMKESSSLSLLTFLSKVFCAYARRQYAWRHTYVCSFPPPTQAAKQIYYLLHFKKHIILKTRQTYKKKNTEEKYESPYHHHL